MGTSSNQPSPSSKNWQLAKAALGTPTVGISRQLSEIWKAALAERGHELLADLTSSPMTRACRLAIASEEGPAAAMSAFDRTLRAERVAGFTFDLCRRALGRTVASGG